MSKGSRGNRMSKINLSRVRALMPKIIDQLNTASSVINVKGVHAIVREVQRLIKQLDGVDLDERTAVESGGVGDGKQRARLSQNLNLLGDRLGYAAQLVRIQSHGHDGQTSQYLGLLADRFGLAEQLVRAQYWAARGHDDPAAPHSTDADGMDRFQPVLVLAPADGDGDGDSSH